MGKNPAWDPLLAIIPADLHSKVEPLLEQWDQGVNQKFATFAPFKQFVDSQVDPEWLGQAARFAQDFERDPSAFFGRVNEQLELGFVPAEEAQRQTPEGNEGSDMFGNDPDSMQALLDSPAFKEVREAVLSMQQRQQQDDEEAKRQEELEAFEADIDNFLGDKGNINKVFFANLRAAGLSNEAALTEYTKTVAQMMGQDPATFVLPSTTSDKGEQPNNGQAPTIMGGDGNVGSGQPTEPLKYGAMKNDEVDDIVMQMLQQAQGN